MQKLKGILIQCFSGAIHRVKITAGETPIGTSADGDAPIPGGIPFTDQDMDQLLQFLFPNDQQSLDSGQVTRGALNIPGKGKILLIASPTAPKSVRLYLPPDGIPLFDKDWVKVNSQTIAPAPPGPAPAAPASDPPLGAGGFVPPDLAAPPPAAAPVVAPISAPPPAAPTPADLGGIPEMAPPLAGFDPGEVPALGDDDDMDAFGPGGADFGTPSHIQPPIAPAAPMTPPPGPMPQPIGLDEMPHAAPPVARPMPMAAPQQMAMPAPQPMAMAAPQPMAAPSGPVNIEFSAERPGESIVSDGNFPIDAVFKQMIELGASDLHMTMGQPICFRIDGSIQRAGTNVLDEASMKSFLMPTMPEDNQREFSEIDDTDYAYEVRGLGRFRVNIFRDRNGVGAVMRHIPSKILTAQQLGLPESILQFCRLTKGLVVVTGPTGSGKSTTLAAMVDEINKTRDDHILTIEDPIEFVHPQQKCLVNQREVGRHTGSFSRALKAALREDPDIVLIGEMRDLETIEIAIETAETGHLVFGTLHTTTAIGTVDRIIDQFPADQQVQVRMMLASSLKGVIAQTLLKKIGGGRVAAHEILVGDPSVSAMIRESKNHMIENHMQSQKRSGNLLLNDSLTRLVKEGKVAVKEAFVKSVDKKGFLLTLKRSGINFDPSQDFADAS